jgi:hypothetical protein
MSKDKNVENKNEGVGRGKTVRVWARGVSPSIYFHFQHFYLSTYVPFLFSTFLPFDQSRGNRSSERNLTNLLEEILNYSIASFFSWSFTTAEVHLSFNRSRKEIFFSLNNRNQGKRILIYSNDAYLSRFRQRRK